MVDVVHIIKKPGLTVDAQVVAQRTRSLATLLPAILRRRTTRGPQVSFGARLLLAILLTLALVGALGYALMAHQLRQNQIADYADAQRADVRSLEAVAREDDATSARTAMDQLVAAIARRQGVIESLLIDDRSIVVASDTAGISVGRRDSDPRIAAALRHGVSYAGLEADPERDGRDFEFVAPVQLPDGRHVLEVSYDYRVLDADLAGLRHTLVVIGLLAFFGGTVVFYLVGGRMLLRSHRIALQRATRDGLTDLPNHRAFQDEFPRAVAAARRFQEPLAIIVFDLDDFKFINDRHGHPHGDAILNRVAGVLAAGRTEDRAFRIGGDEFAMLLPHTDGDGARTIAGRLHRAFTEVEVAVSMGVSDLHEGESDEDLRAGGDAALYEAKRSGRHIAHFDEIRDRVVITTSARTDRVRRLIDDVRLSMVYQPIWDLGSRRLLGIEALMRPDDGELSGPAEAFDLAEKIGRVQELDMLCVTHALSTIPDLPDQALLFLNISPQTLDLDADGPDWLLRLVAQAGLAPARVVIEVTERFGARTDAVVVSLRRLRGEGFKLALDDVGTGNSGLEMLQKVNADFVKIDRGIVLSAATDRSARAVLMAMATYAHQTGAYVIAEGIEDQETLDFLDAIDDHDVRIDRIIQGGQGFGLGRPAPGDAIAKAPDLLVRPGEPTVFLSNRDGDGHRAGRSQ
jgi:diguanylate cyclase (GGDEF)-like protein